MDSIDISKAILELSNDEKKLVSWLEENNFKGKIEKQLKSKTKFLVKKDGVSYLIELPCVPNIKIDSFIKDFNRSFEMFKKLKGAE